MDDKYQALFESWKELRVEIAEACRFDDGYLDVLLIHIADLGNRLRENGMSKKDIIAVLGLD